MADDAIATLLTTGGSMVAGGGVSAVAVRFLFASFKEQLVDMTRTLKEFIDKSEGRHEKLIERIAAIEAKADAAHRRLDERQRRR